MRMILYYNFLCIYCIYYNTLLIFFSYFFMPSWRNWISRLTSNQKSVGSSPTGGNKKLFISNSIPMCSLLCLTSFLYRKLLYYFTPSREKSDNIGDVYYALK